MSAVMLFDCGILLSGVEKSADIQGHIFHFNTFNNYRFYRSQLIGASEDFPNLTDGEMKMRGDS